MDIIYVKLGVRYKEKDSFFIHSDYLHEEAGFFGMLKGRQSLWGEKETSFMWPSHMPPQASLPGVSLSCHIYSQIYVLLQASPSSKNVFAFSFFKSQPSLKSDLVNLSQICCFLKICPSNSWVSLCPPQRLPGPPASRGSGVFPLMHIPCPQAETEDHVQLAPCIVFMHTEIWESST